MEKNILSLEKENCKKKKKKTDPVCYLGGCGGLHLTIVRMATHNEEGISDDKHCLGRGMRVAGFGESKGQLLHPLGTWAWTWTSL